MSVSYQPDKFLQTIKCKEMNVKWQKYLHFCRSSLLTAINKESQTEFAPTGNRRQESATTEGLKTRFYKNNKNVETDLYRVTENVI